MTVFLPPSRYAFIRIRNHRNMRLFTIMFQFSQCNVSQELQDTSQVDVLWLGNAIVGSSIAPSLLLQGTFSLVLSRYLPVYWYIMSAHLKKTSSGCCNQYEFTFLRVLGILKTFFLICILTLCRNLVVNCASAIACWFIIDQLS